MRLQNIGGSTSFLLSKSPSMPKFMTSNGEKSLALPWMYSIPELSNLTVESWMIGLGILVYLHSKWFFISAITWSILNYLAIAYLMRCWSSRRISLPFTIAREFGVNADFGSLGPNGFWMSKSILCFFFSSALIFITDYFSHSVKLSQPVKYCLFLNPFFFKSAMFSTLRSFKLGTIL